MRPTTAVYRAAITASHGVLTKVSSHRSGTVLAPEVPVIEGTITYDDTATLRRRLSLTVPDFDVMTGRSWDPADDASHPLAAYGQRLHVRTGIRLPDGGKVLFDHGWYLITDWDRNEADRTVQVSAVDLAQLLADARHYTTESPKRGTTYRTEFVRLADGILPTVIDPDLSITAKVNSATVWDRERTRNLDDLCKAWGARWYVDDGGNLHASKAYPPVTSQTPYVTRFVGGARGTIVTRSRSATRERLYNAVVVTGKTNDTDVPDAVAPYGYAEITDRLSPIRVSGPYGRKPRFYSSEMLTTSADCTKTARQLLTGASSISRSEPITAVPDCALELGDVAEVLTSGTAWRGRITTITLPLTAEAGAMSVTLANQPADDDEEAAATPAVVTQTDADQNGE